MSALLVFLLLAFILLFALLSFLDTDHSSTLDDRTPSSFSSGQPGFCDNQEFASLGNLVFSDQDWKFIQREQSPFLNRLFIEQRRAVITHWLRESATRLRAIRINHLQHSRHSANLNVLAEAKLFFLFFYLAFLCWSLLLIVRFSHPSTPRALALHFQSAASKLFSSAPGALAPAGADQHPPLSPRIP